MDVEQLRHHLFDETSRLYAILDGVMVTDLPVRLYKAQIPNYCLITGDLGADMIHAAPYLVFLPPGDNFTEWVLSEGFGLNCGIFARSRASMVDMRRHFGSLLSVYDEQGNSMTFRYYDPRVWRKFLPTCTPKELQTVFGNVDNFFAEDGENLLSFKMENGRLKKTELT